MIPYKSKSGKTSGVSAFEIGENYLLVQFRGGIIYKYSNLSCGISTVQTMVNLAKNSKGLSTYIAQNKPKYESKR